MTDLRLTGIAALSRAFPNDGEVSRSRVVSRSHSHTEVIRIAVVAVVSPEVQHGARSDRILLIGDHEVVRIVGVVSAVSVRGRNSETIGFVMTPTSVVIASVGLAL